MVVAALGFPYAALWADPSSGALDAALERLESSLPAEPAAFSEADAAARGQLVAQIDELTSDLAGSLGRLPPEQVLARSDVLLSSANRISALLEATLQQRAGFAALGDDEAGRAAIRSYLRAVAQLIDLSGRLRYTLRDGLDAAAMSVSAEPRARDKLVELLTEHRSQVGAVVATPWLFDPEPDGRPLPASLRVSDATKAAVLKLVSASGYTGVLPDVADFLRENKSPGLSIAAAETIRSIGLPQDPRPGQDESLPAPAITAAEFNELLAAIAPSKLSEEDARRHAELLAWSERRASEGVTDAAFRLGQADLMPGNWLLMRNPSPYNRFTDLEPGLFTHVGVIAEETGSDGRRRLVLVDLPERGTEMPATNLDLFVQRTLHYVVLRHNDPEYGRRMAKVAASVIGNETQFDLNFRTSRVEELKGQPLEGRKIHTYCAGLLLLCAQETPGERTDFFPLTEYPAAGNTRSNLAKLGLSIGDDFVSPTGAMFSPDLRIVARSEPMYEPTREIEEAVFDHFASSLVDKTLRPSASTYQSLRVKLAQAAEVTPLLGRALAAANGVSPDMDLVAAAKAAAVVENLDEIAYAASGDFLAARDALRAGPISDLVAQGASREAVEQVRSLRQRHSELYGEWIKRRLTPRDLRLKLVEYYSQRGRRQIEEAFFSRAE